MHPFFTLLLGLVIILMALIAKTRPHEHYQERPVDKDIIEEVKKDGK